MPDCCSSAATSFVCGDYAAARADYDSALAVSRGNERASFAPFRAYVSAYRGQRAGPPSSSSSLVTPPMDGAA